MKRVRTELEDTIELANRLLDEPNCDPDDDLRMLSRQLLRLLAHRIALLKAVRYALNSLSQTSTYEVPPIVVRDVAEMMNKVNQDLNIV